MYLSHHILILLLIVLLLHHLSNHQISKALDEYIKFCINTYQDNYSDVELANMLGISRKSLWEKRRKYEITKRR